VSLSTAKFKLGLLMLTFVHQSSVQHTSYPLIEAAEVTTRPMWDSFNPTKLTLVTLAYSNESTHSLLSKRSQDLLQTWHHPTNAKGYAMTDVKPR